MIYIPLFSFAGLFPSLGGTCCEKWLHPNDTEFQPSSSWLANRLPLHPAFPSVLLFVSPFPLFHSVLYRLLPSLSPLPFFFPPASYTVSNSPFSEIWNINTTTLCFIAFVIFCFNIISFFYNSKQSILLFNQVDRIVIILIFPKECQNLKLSVAFKDLSANNLKYGTRLCGGHNGI